MQKNLLALLFAMYFSMAGIVHAGETITVTVSEGDYLVSLCEKYLDDPANDWPKIARLNHLANPHLISPGDILLFPVDLLKGLPLNGTITFLKGDVKIQRQESTSWEPLEFNDTIVQGEKIRTLDQSAVEISYEDGDVLFLRHNTEITVDSARIQTDTNRVYQMFIGVGRVSNTIRRSTGKKVRYEVRTPSAVAAVRGTEFRARVEENAVTRIEVLEGSVNVASDKSKTDIGAGQGAVITEKTTAPQKATLLAPPRLLDRKDLYRKMPLAFAFEPVPDAASARVMLARDSSFKDVVKEKTVDPGGTLQVVGVDDGVYFLGSLSIDRLGLEGPFGEPDRINVRVNPLPPFLQSPEAGASFKGKSTELVWLKVKDAIAYHLQLALDSDFSSPVLDKKDSEATKYQTGELPYGTYYYRISSLADDGYEGIWSDPGYFTLIPPPPVPPMDPPDLGKGEHVRVGWRNLGEGIRYQVQVSNVMDFGTLLLDKEVTTPEIIFDRPKKVDTYYVRTRAMDPDGYTGNWSEPQSFTIPYNLGNVAVGTFLVTLLLIIVL